MKNNISYYSHDTNSHHSWKFKTLRRKYGWSGEGRFWALANMIGESENCILSIGEESKQFQIAADLDLSPEEFTQFIEFLTNKCKLLIINEGNITTDRAQETLQGVMKKRTYQSNWAKKKSNIENGNLSIETKVSNIETKKSNIENEQSKVKESKVNYSFGVKQPQPVEGYRDIENLKPIILKDEGYISLIVAKGIKPDLVEGWIDAFNRMLRFKNTTLFVESEYRRYFAHWLVKVPNVLTIHPNQYSPVNSIQHTQQKQDYITQREDNQKKLDELMNKRGGK